MPDIRLLPDRVANQIAAGEVIERPVAVVKELLENSLDAGATRVEVEFRNGGRSYIRVEDNGKGMTEDDALMSLERHATSKIREADDLLSIGSYGFRGEALPSIASVSRFSLKSRPDGQEEGTEVLVNGGKMVHVKACGMPQGTRMEVSHLFNSVPARRKFLKTDNTEGAHIVQLVRVYAIANPQTAFQLIENGRLVFQSPACPNVHERVREVFGNQVADQLIPIEANEGEYRLHGLIGKPGVGRSTRHELLTMVNRRPVESPTLNRALIESYHTFIAKGRYPLAFLFLTMDPAGVDVNVHPAKREVRFRDSAKIRSFLIRSTLEVLRREQGLDEQAPASEPEAAPAPSLGKTVSKPTQPPAASTQKKPKEGKPESEPQPTSEPQETPRAKPALSASSGSGKMQAQALTAKAAPKASDWRVGWKFIGFVQRGLAVFDTDRGVILLDRRAAHQRILYEDLERQFKDHAVAAQQLLIPVPLELDAIASHLLLDHLDFLNENGFEIAEFGRNFFRIQSVPVWTSPEAAESLVRDVIGLIREGTVNRQKPMDAFSQLAKLACQRAVRLDDHVTEKEVVSLASRLLRCEHPLMSPLGRPTFIELSSAELKKRFNKS